MVSNSPLQEDFARRGCMVLGKNLCVQLVIAFKSEERSFNPSSLCPLKLFSKGESSKEKALAKSLEIGLSWGGFI